jgi:hypothetical protein
LTKSYLKLDFNTSFFYNSWEQSIIAPKFTLRNFIDEMHYYLRFYIRKKRKVTIILIYLFLNATQRIFYTLGTFLIKTKLSNKVINCVKS